MSMIHCALYAGLCFACSLCAAAMTPVQQETAPDQVTGQQQSPRTIGGPDANLASGYWRRLASALLGKDDIFTRRCAADVMFFFFSVFYRRGIGLPS
jgi:hypothetical protein